MSETAETQDQRKRVVLTDRYAGGPHGLGDPDDRFLRKVEVEVIIPKIVRERSRKEKCPEEVRAFSQCSADNGLLMVVKCRQESNVLKDCLGKWFHDENFTEECRNEYLAERSEYRRTGVSKKAQEKAKQLGSNRIQSSI